MQDATRTMPQQRPLHRRRIRGHRSWPTLCLVEATPEAQLKAATARRKRILKQAEAARLAERSAIMAALDSGIRQVDVVAVTGYTREHVRRLDAAEREARGLP